MKLMNRIATNTFEKLNRLVAQEKLSFHKSFTRQKWPAAMAMI